MSKSKPIKLNSPKYKVVFGDPEDDETWTELDVQAITRDITAAETMFATSRWGKMLDSPVKAMAVSAYFALRRTGRIEGDWASFEAAYIDIGQVEVEAVDPTPPGLDPGS